MHGSGGPDGRQSLFGMNLLTDLKPLSLAKQSDFPRLRVEPEHARGLGAGDYPPRRAPILRDGVHMDDSAHHHSQAPARRIESQH